MTGYEPLDRRSFIISLGKGVFGVAVLGGVFGACSTDGTPTTTAASTTGGPSTAPPVTTDAPAPSSTATTSPPDTTAGLTDGVAVERVNLGFVSAYVLVRGTEAAIVDTGGSGSEGAIEAVLSELGLGWGAVGHVILTHLHGDHVGSLSAVLTAASAATAYAGVADVAGITSPRPLTAVGDGDRVFDLEIVETPGHTPGHISVFDRARGALIAGDAINGSGSGVDGASSGVAGPNPDFTPDMTGAMSSVAKLAALEPATVFFGHGEPFTGDATAALRRLSGET